MKSRIVMKGPKESGKWKYYLDGKEVSKEEHDLAVPDKPLAEAGKCSLRGWSRPIESDAMAVHPKQIAEVMERNKRHGLTCEYNTEDGRPILTSREQRRQLMKIEGFHDNSGSFGDETGNSTTKPPDADFSHLDDV